MTSLSAPTDPAQLAEGFYDIDGAAFYAIPAVDQLQPFLMSIVSADDHWMFVSSCGALTAGRGDATRALFPYETDDRLHRAGGSTGPATVIRARGDGPGALWEPFSSDCAPGAVRNLYKSVVGDEVIFEEANRKSGLIFRYRWSTSDRFGFVRTATLANHGREAVSVELVDGLIDILPAGLEPSLYQRMSNLTNAYKRSELVDADLSLAVFSLESLVVDRAEPAESLFASTVWSAGLESAVAMVNPESISAARRGVTADADRLVTGRAGGYFLSAAVDLPPGQNRSWSIVADVDQSQSDVVALRAFLEESADPMRDVRRSIGGGTGMLHQTMATSDAGQRTGNPMITAHHYANVTYNVLRGGVFLDGYDVAADDFREFLAMRNRLVAGRHTEWAGILPASIGHNELIGRAQATGDPQLVRIASEYLPLSFSRRHGDPSRPWNQFSIKVRDTSGAPILHHEGNWRDIFQNWEALALSFPQYLPSMVSVFVNSSTADGFNPYRIAREGFDWEAPEPDNPWSNIGYWGDHQIVYLLRLLRATDRYLPGAVRGMLGCAQFSYAQVPYRLARYDALVCDPHNTISYDEQAARESESRVGELGQDGKLALAADREPNLVTLLEKLILPALAKLANFVPGGGIWMNTQRPEWNDANNALVGNGLSMVTLYYLRSYLEYLDQHVASSGIVDVPMSREVAQLLRQISEVLRRHSPADTTELTDQHRRLVIDELGGAFSAYRWQVYESGLSDGVPVPLREITELCRRGVEHLDDTIHRNQRPDGLYHSYNLVGFEAERATVAHLQLMLEGQVAVLSCGALDFAERVGVVERLFSSALYRPDQGSFMLYPERIPPSFLEKNIVPDDLVADNPLLTYLVEARVGALIERDAHGLFRFHPSLRNLADLEAALTTLSDQAETTDLVRMHWQQTLDDYERVFRHREFTGRSGAMYRYEGIGSIYWHMVAKLLAAVQESLVEANDAGADQDIVDRLTSHYQRIRRGLGYNKAAAQYGAFPADPYSHTPAHSGAQQPGMTGQVKEEMITRLLETGIRVVAGELRFDPVLLSGDELLVEETEWTGYGVGGSPFVIRLPAGSFGVTVCQVPVVVAVTNGTAKIEVGLHDGERRTISGLSLGREISGEIFARTRRVEEVRVDIPVSDLPQSPT